MPYLATSGLFLLAMTYVTGCLQADKTPRWLRITVSARRSVWTNLFHVDKAPSLSRLSFCPQRTANARSLSHHSFVLGATSAHILVFLSASATQFYASLLGCALLHVTAMVVPPPARYPHIHELATVAWSCGHLLAFFLYFNFRQFTLSGADVDYKPGVSDAAQETQMATPTAKKTE